MFKGKDEQQDSSLRAACFIFFLFCWKLKYSYEDGRHSNKKGKEDEFKTLKFFQFADRLHLSS